MEKIHIGTSEKYDVILGENVFHRIPSLILPFCPTKKVLIVTDDIVDELYGNSLVKILTENGFETNKFVFKNGEPSKNIQTLSDILEFAAKCNFHRKDTFIALGGGVVGDITGLASALYMRGVSVIQIPTTLLSAVDSSVGGKTAIDLKNGKNLAGVFKQPELVICDTEIIKNLPRDIFCEGMAEVIKCNIISSLSVIDHIKKGTLFDNLSHIIKECITLKRDIVEKDEFDTLGIRNYLNVGHTIAHGIELLSNYSIPHGKAVGTGMVIEAQIAEKSGICRSDTVKEIFDAVSAFGLYFDLPFSKEDLSLSCLKDKKNKDSRIIFLLPEELGKCKEVSLSKEELLNLL